MTTPLIVMDHSSSSVQFFLNLPVDLLVLSLKYLSLANLVIIRRVCGHLRSVVDSLLMRRKRISKKDMSYLSFDDREWLLKDMSLTNLESVSLVSIELNEDLARHLGQFSPVLRTICVDGTCYNRCFEFVDTYLTTHSQFHPNRRPCLQVEDLIELDDNIQRLLSKFSKWSVNLRISSSNLSSWKESWTYVHTIVVTKIKNTFDIVKLPCDVSSSYPNLQTLVFNGVDLDDCLMFRPLIEVVEGVIIENLNIRNYPILLTLNETKLKTLQINFNHHKGKQWRQLFLETLAEYLSKHGKCLEFLKVTTNHRDDSIQLIKIIVNLGFENLKFIIGNPSDQFSYLRRRLTMRYWIDSLDDLLQTFSDVKEMKIITNASFNVLEWIGETKAFAAGHRNRCLNVSISIEGHPENGQLITINGSNYKLIIPKIVGLSFKLTLNNVLFAFNLAEMSQMTDLRNQALSFMKYSIGSNLSNSFSSRDICDLFKSIQNK